MVPPPPRADVLKQIAASGRTGNLGFFVGSGFGKALTANRAPNWKGILSQVADALDLPSPYMNADANIGRSFPAVASCMVDELVGHLKTKSRFKDADYATLRAEATAVLKMEIARKSGIVADEPMRKRAHDALAVIQPSWFMTTNYDFLIEQVVDHHDTLLPSQVLLPRHSTTPVFHLHGHRNAPGTIVITEEDYAQLLPRIDYRFAKLSLLLAESTTVFIGYSLSDINVQTALHLARALLPTSKELRSARQGRLVLVEWSNGNAPEANSRVGRYGETIIQTPNIVEFLEETRATRDDLDQVWKQAQQTIDGLTLRPDFNQRFIDDANVRKGVIATLVNVPAALAGTAAAELLQGAFTEIAARAGDGKEGFPHYAKWLNALLDVFEQWSVGLMSPFLFDVLARELGSVLLAVCETNERIAGYSWAATEAWHTRKRAFAIRQADLYEQLVSFSKREGDSNMTRRLAQAKES